MGDRLALAVRVKSGQDGGNVAWQVSAYNGSSGSSPTASLLATKTGLSRQFADAASYNEFDVPAGTVTLQFSMKVAPVNG